MTLCFKGGCLYESPYNYALCVDSYCKNNHTFWFYFIVRNCILNVFLVCNYLSFMLLDRFDDVMVSTTNHAFNFRSCQNKDDEIGMCYFSVNHKE